MEIVFLRHAEKESMGEDPYLTDKGIKQAGFIAKRLRGLDISEFYCSDLNRSKQTAKIIFEKIKIPAVIDKSLNEFKSETIKKPKNQWTSEEKSHYKGLKNMLKRITKDSNNDKTVLIVGHGVTNRIILAHFLELNLKNVIRFTQKETGLNSIYWMDKFKNWRLRIWNDDNHIPQSLKSTKGY